MDEAANAASRRRGEHRQGPGDIAELEGRGICGGDDPGDVDYGVGAIDQAFERGAVVEVPVDPFKPVARRLVAASQRFHMVTGGERRIEEMRADEARAAGNRKLHSGDQRPSSPASSWSSAAEPRRSMRTSSNGSMPSSSGAEIGKTLAPVAFSSALTVLARCLASRRSALVSAMISRLASSPAP